VSERPTASAKETRVRIHTILVMTALCLGLGRSAAAQQPGMTGRAVADLSGGYAWLHEKPPSDAESETYPTGWVASGAFRFAGSMMVVGEVGGNYRTNAADESAHLHAFLGGVRFGIGRWEHAAVFVQGLAGMERFTEPGLTQSGFAVQFGGGVDLKLKGALGARTQIDYRVADEDGYTFKETRFSFGAVWSFRGK
jgi:hypothetical protein